MLRGSVVLCKEKSVDSTNLSENVTLSASGRAVWDSMLGWGLLLWFSLCSPDCFAYET